MIPRSVPRSVNALRVLGCNKCIGLWTCTWKSDGLRAANRCSRTIWIQSVNRCWIRDWGRRLIISQFNGTSTPKGSHRAKTGDNGCNVNSSHYSLSTALCESTRCQAKSEHVRQELIRRVRHGEAGVKCYENRTWFDRGSIVWRREMQLWLNVMEQFVTVIDEPSLFLLCRRD